MAFATLVLRLVRALLPVATLYVGKLIIDEVVRQARGPAVHLARAAGRALGGWLASGEARPILVLLAVELGLAVSVRRVGPPGLAHRVAPRRTLRQHRQRAFDGARRDARPRRLRGQRDPGPDGARAAASGGAFGPAEPALRPGAGRRDDRRLRRRPGLLRALADRTPGARGGASFRRRIPLQRRGLRIGVAADPGPA